MIRRADFDTTSGKSHRLDTPARIDSRSDDIARWEYNEEEEKFSSLLPAVRCSWIDDFMIPFPDLCALSYRIRFLAPKLIINVEVWCKEQCWSIEKKDPNYVKWKWRAISSPALNFDDGYSWNDFQFQFLCWQPNEMIVFSISLTLAFDHPQHWKFGRCLF